jgi:hypothetical protein
MRMDFSKYAMRAGKHQGVINLSGDWKNNKDDSGMHDIWSITKK